MFLGLILYMNFLCFELTEFLISVFMYFFGKLIYVLLRFAP